MDVLVEEFWQAAQQLKSPKVGTLTQRLRHIQLRLHGEQE